MIRRLLPSALLLVASAHAALVPAEAQRTSTSAFRAGYPRQAPIDAGATDSTATRKSAVTATLLAYLFPGGGHYYAGEPGRGAIITSAFAIGFTFGFMRDTPNFEGSGLLLIGVAAGAYLYGIWDAHNAVRRANNRRQRAYPDSSR